MFVQFQRGKNGNPIAFIDKKVAFPPRDSSVKEGEWWEVQIKGENPTKTVYFLTLLSRFDDLEEIVGKHGAAGPWLINSEESSMGVRTPIHPREYHFIAGESEIGQVWKCSINHQQHKIYPLERIYSDKEIRQEAQLAYCVTIAQLLNSLLATSEKFRFVPSKSNAFCDEVYVMHKRLPCHVGKEHVIASHLDTTNARHFRHFIDIHLEEWREGSLNAERRNAHAVPDYSVDKDSMGYWLGHKPGPGWE